MSINQNVRFGTEGDEGNPLCIMRQYKPSRILTLSTDPVDPPNGTGEDLDYCINTTTGSFWFRDPDIGGWILIYNFTTSPGSGILDLANDGVGAALFKSVIANVGHLRTLLSSTGKITFATLPNELDLTVNINSNDVALGNVQNIKSNFLATADPTNFNDSSPGQGYSIGSFWLNRATNPSRLFICEVAIPTAAVWELLAGGSGTITTIQNVGTGVGVLRNITTGIANLRSLTSTTGKITYVNGGDTINTGVNLVKADVGLSLVPNHILNFESDINPGPSDDASLGFAPGDLWSNWALANVFMNRTNSVGSAVWTQVGGQFIRNDNDYIMVRKHPGNDFTVLSTGVNTTLNVGFSVYDLIQSKGVWQRLNLGAGPVVVQRTAVSNGSVNARYSITYCWTGYLQAQAVGEYRFGFGMNLGTGASPTTGFQVGSGSLVVFTNGQLQTSTHSCTYIFTATSAFAQNLYITVASFDASLTLVTSDLTWTIQQLE